MSVTIKIDNLVKRFENFTAISNLNLEIYNNEIFGLLGPNWAGKTTLIHILATLIKPTSGTAIINGFDILKQSSKVRASIGIVFQSPSSDDMLTGYENLKIHSLDLLRNYLQTALLHDYFIRHLLTFC